MNTAISTALVRQARQPETHHFQQVLVVSFDEPGDATPIPDDERDLMIQIEGLQLRLQMAIWARTGNAKAREAAQAHELRQRQLCLGRSPAVQARMAIERGLPHG